MTAHTIARRKSGRTFESTARIAARSEAFLSGISGLRGVHPVCQRLARHAQSTGWVVSDSPRQVEELLGGRPSDRELPVGGASLSADARGHLQVAASTVLVRFITGARSSWSIQASADPVVEGGVDRSVPGFSVGSSGCWSGSWSALSLIHIC